MSVTATPSVANMVLAVTSRVHRSGYSYGNACLRTWRLPDGGQPAERILRTRRAAPQGSVGVSAPADAEPDVGRLGVGRARARRSLWRGSAFSGFVPPVALPSGSLQVLTGVLNSRERWTRDVTASTMFATLGVAVTLMDKRQDLLRHGGGERVSFCASSASAPAPDTARGRAPRRTRPRSSPAPARPRRRPRWPRAAARPPPSAAPQDLLLVHRQQPAVIEHQAPVEIGPSPHGRAVSADARAGGGRRSAARSRAA